MFQLVERHYQRYKRKEGDKKVISLVKKLKTAREKYISLF